MNGVYYKRFKLSTAVNQATDGQLIKKFGSSRERLELNFRGQDAINDACLYLLDTKADWIWRNSGNFGEGPTIR